MTNLIPNSPEFARLNAFDKLSVLVNRWKSRVVIHSHQPITLAELRKPEKPEKPKCWYYESDIEALKRWQDRTHLARCSTKADAKLNNKPIKDYKELLQQ